MDTDVRLSFGELFCGAGGMAWGLQEAGLTPAWAVDADPWACATYRKMLGDHVRRARVEDMPFAAMDRPGGLAFGFPCNDFSMVGEKKGTGGYFGGLFRHAVRALHECDPDWFIAENVPGLMARGGEDIMQAFADAGYRLSVHVYKFEDYGVPQKRHRVIAVGIRTSLGLEFCPPAPTHREPVGAAAALKGVEKIAHNNEPSRHTDKVRRMLESIPPGENVWHPAVPEDLRLNVPNVRMSLIYRRLHPRQPAYTVVGSGGGGTHTYHWKEPRALTNRERARLQSFPDHFVFEGPKEAVRKQIGMAVPPRGAQIIGEALLKTLRGENYDWVKPSVGVLEPKHVRAA